MRWVAPSQDRPNAFAKEGRECKRYTLGKGEPRKEKNGNRYTCYKVLFVCTSLIKYILGREISQKITKKHKKIRSANVIQMDK